MKKLIIRLIAIVIAIITIFTVIDRASVIFNSINNETVSALKSKDKKHSGQLILVNKDNKYYDTGEELERLYDYKDSSFFVSTTEIYLQKEAIEPLCKMLKDFNRQTGLRTINVISGYRSVESQQSIYQKNLKSKGNAYTKKYVQTPGNSEHHTGLAIDLALYNPADGSSKDFTGTGDYKWFSDHAFEYGYIIRYPESKAKITGIAYEPWHLRYVGIEHATYMVKNDLCLEEYIEILRGHSKNDPLRFKVDGKTVNAWFSKKSTKIFNCSGDNSKGFICWR